MGSVNPVKEKKKYIHYLNNNDADELAHFAQSLQYAEQARLELFQNPSDVLFQVNELPVQAKQQAHER